MSCHRKLPSRVKRRKTSASTQRNYIRAEHHYTNLNVESLGAGLIGGDHGSLGAGLIGGDHGSLGAGLIGGDHGSSGAGAVGGDHGSSGAGAVGGDHGSLGAGAVGGDHGSLGAGLIGGDHGSLGAGLIGGDDGSLGAGAVGGDDLADDNRSSYWSESGATNSGCGGSSFNESTAIDNIYLHNDNFAPSTNAADEERLKALYGSKFDFVELVKIFMSCNEPLPEDYLRRVNEQSNVTVQEFHEELCGAFDRGGGTDALFKDVVSILKRNLPNEYFGNKHPQSYSKRTRRMMEIITCPKGCMAFVGDAEHERVCKVCATPKYRPCVRGACRGKSSSPEQEARCTHLGERTPWATLYYRPLLATIQTLLETKSFEHIYNWKLHLPSRTSSDYQMLDITQSNHYLCHMEGMRRRYLDAVPPSEREITKMINLNLARGYDGAQIYRSKTSVFSPFFVQILNLPPPLRTDVGIGIFQMFLLSGSDDNEVAAFQQRCFISELRSLYDGRHFTTKDGRKFFVQARLIVHDLDTKALEKEFNIRLSTTATLCPLCNCIGGRSNSNLGKIIFTGIRSLLPKEHLLRCLGVSGQCCPYGQHVQKSNWVEEHMSASIELRRIINKQASIRGTRGEYSLAQREELDDLRSQRLNINQELEPKVENADMYVDILQKRNNRPTLKCGTVNSLTISCDRSMSQEEVRLCCEKGVAQGLWLHDEFPFRDSFRAFVWFEHANMRRVEYKRLETAEYLAKATSAERRRSAVVDGIKGRCEYSVKLPYFHWAKDIQSDPFHTLAKLFEEDMAIQKGLRANSLKARIYAKSKNLFFPFFHSDDQKPPWLVSETVQHISDAWINCILVPKSYSGRWQISFPYQHHGQMRGNGRIRFGIACADLVNLIQSWYDQGSNGVVYRQYRAMIASDVQDLLDPMKKKICIPRLYDRLNETMSLRAGLFGDSECKGIQHAVAHLPYALEDFAALQSFWTLQMERAISSVKKFVPRGGTRYYKTTMFKYDAMEQERTRYALGCEPALLLEKDFCNTPTIRKGLSSVYSKEMFRRVNGSLVYDPFMMRLFDREGKLPNKLDSSYEREGLLELTWRVVSRQFNGDEKRCAFESPSFRIMMAQQKLYDQRLFRTKERTEWLEYLKNIYVSNAAGTVVRDLQLPISDHATPQLKEKFTDVEVSPTSDWWNLVQDGCIIISDLAIVESLMSMDLELYKNATIYGMRFSSRGWECRERSSPKVTNDRYGVLRQDLEYTYNCERNNLRKHLEIRNDRSCWCKFRSEWLHESHDEGRFGLLNSFFRLKVPEDRLLNGFPVASITTFQHEIVANVPRVDCGAAFKSSYFRYGLLFIPIDIIYASPFAPLPFVTSADGKKKPLNAKLTDSGISKDNRSHFADNREKIPTGFYLVEMFPERKRIRFDADNMKMLLASHFDGNACADLDDMSDDENDILANDAMELISVVSNSSNES